MGNFGDPLYDGNWSAVAWGDSNRYRWKLLLQSDQRLDLSGGYDYLDEPEREPPRFNARYRVNSDRPKTLEKP